MKSLILRTASRYLILLLLLFSILTLLRGHNLPGGGFAGGLLAATAIALFIFAFGPGAAKHAIPVDPHVLVGAGLVVALGSGFAGMLGGRAFLTGRWISIGESAIGTPIVFDIGVYLVVMGSSLMMLLSLTEKEERD